MFLQINFILNSQPIGLSGILLTNRKNPPKGVSFSDFICTFAKSFRVSFIIKCNTKISEISDMAKSCVTRDGYCITQQTFHYDCND